jgi:putative ABC transport system permease protein
MHIGLRLVTAALRRLVDASFADAVVGDLLEERGRRARAGRRAARTLWFWRALVTVTVYTAASVFTDGMRRFCVRTLAIDRWRADLRVALRSLRASPSFSAVALTVFTLGIGASTAIFSVVDAVVLRPLPFHASDRLVSVSETMGDSRGQHRPFPPPAASFFAWQGTQDVFSALAAVADADVNLDRDGADAPVILRGQRVTRAFFDVLAVRPVLGRTFTAEDDIHRREDVAVISYGLWQRRFGGGHILGRRIRAVDRTIEIVGVMPRGFEYPAAATSPTDIWTLYPAPAGGRGASGPRLIEALGRLKGGVSLASAHSRMTQIASRLPTAATGAPGILVRPLRESLANDVRSWMLLLLGAVTCVLAIACANVATLTLGRVVPRAREFGVRAALGATRWDLARPVLLETLLLAGGGAAGGVLLAYWGVDLLRSAMPPGVPRTAAIAVNVRVLTAAGSTAAVAGLVSGLAAVLHLSRRDRSASLKTHGLTRTQDVRRRRMGGALVVAEVALAVVLTVGAALFITSFRRVASIDIGLDVRDVSMMTIAPWIDRSNEKDLRSRIDEDGRRLLRIAGRVSDLPGVDAAVTTGVAPLSGVSYITSTPISIPGRELPRQLRLMRVASVSANYFRVLGIPVLRGRAFETSDTATAPPVVIVNATAARTYFGSPEAAIGQTIFNLGNRTVVGVIGDVRPRGPEEDPAAELYFPFAQRLMETGVLIVRSPNLGAALPAIRQTIWEEFPDVGLPDARTLDSHLHDYTARREFNMLLLSLFGLLGLIIAAVGLYGVMASQVAQRTQEIGVRMALGAVPATIVRAMLGRAAAYIAGGLVLGLTGAWALSGLVRGFLFRVEPGDPRLYAAGAGALVAVALAAAALPARRAAGVDPAVVLRQD